jgi:hypothetical protein
MKMGFSEFGVGKDWRGWRSSSPAWRYREIATSHMIPSNRPGELARLLLELA